MAVIQNKHYTKAELLNRMGSISSIAGIHQIVYQNGFANGLRAYEVINGAIRFTVLIDKCLDIGEFYYEGMPLHYLARPGIMNGNWFYDGENSSRSIMCGMLFTCGLSNVGPLQAADDGKTHPQHGLIRNTPAEQHGARTYWQDDDYYMEITGTMRESSLFGTNLVLHRTITTKLGDTSIQIEDKIENESSTDQVPCMLMYHCNAGFPLLDACSRFKIDPVETQDRDEIAAIGRKQESPFVFGEPIMGYDEQVFYHKLAADMNGWCHAAIQNPETHTSLTISFRNDTLPYLIHWKCKDAGNYVTGIEPSNCHPEGLHKEQENGTLRRLAAHESFTTDIVLHADHF